MARIYGRDVSCGGGNRPQNNTVTETGTAVPHAGEDENIPVTLGKEAYKKTLDLTIYDGRLKNNQEVYTDRSGR